MLIRCFPDKRAMEDNGLAGCGILKYRRTVYVFVNPAEYNGNAVRRAKAVIVNESVSKGSKEGNIVHIAVNNSVLIRTSVYFCGVLFETAGNIRQSQFKVESAYSKEAQSLFDQGRVAHYFTGTYSQAIGRLQATDEYSFNEIINNMDVSVLPPVFYNEVQQYKSTCDIFSMGGTWEEIYSGSELIDNKTRIEFMDINLWDSMRLNVLGLLGETEERAPETFNAASSFHSDFSNFIAEGCLFMYDSDGKGINEPGINIIGGRIPLKNFYVPGHIPSNVRTAYSLFESTCHDVESRYGHVRILCAPDKIGDKIKIKFKDYNLPPAGFVPLGERSADGDSSAIDSGYHVERNINEAIEALQNDPMRSYYRENNYIS
jgi:hypothetical protein